MLFVVKDAACKPVVMFTAENINEFSEHIESLTQKVGLDLVGTFVLRRTCRGWAPIINKEGELCWRGFKS